MKITKLIPRILFGEGEFDHLQEFVDVLFSEPDGYVAYMMDTVHQKTGLRDRLKHRPNDLVVDVDVSDHEPKTGNIDEIRDSIMEQKGGRLPKAVVGIGGGATMDVAKAVSVVLTNKGSSADYQGWDLVRERPVPKVAVPTLSGTGAEATRTAVLTGPTRKLGINSDYSIYDAILMDPELPRTVDREQEFFTGMDCYIHSSESLQGSVANALARPFAQKAKDGVEKFFLEEKSYSELMVASFFGGCSGANAAVGVCHALSYGISLVLGYRHGIANSIVFNQLDEYYGNDVTKFKEMAAKNDIRIPSNVTKGVNDEMMEKMIEMTYMLEKDLVNALGDSWREILTREKVIELYGRM